jgi:DNA-binding MarR family transcriptional regulator
MRRSSIVAAELLREVARLYSRAQRVLADCCDTTGTQCHILSELGRGGPMPMGELGTRLQLEKSWVSRAIDALVERGLVAKEANPSDARSWILSLTAAGKRKFRDLNLSLDSHAAQLLGKLGAKDRQDVQRALSLLLDALREDPSATCCLPVAERKKELLCR